MECRESRERWDDELDGMLAGSARRKLLRHLAGCARCSEELARLRRALEALRETSLVEPSEATRAGLARVARGEERMPAAVPEVLELREVAAYLRVALADLEPLLDELPGFEIAGQIRFRREAIDRWIGEQERAYRTRLRTSVVRMSAG